MAGDSFLSSCCEMAEEEVLQRMVKTMVEKALEEERARTTSRLQLSSGRSIAPSPLVFDLPTGDDGPRLIRFLICCGIAFYTLVSTTLAKH